MNDDPTIEVAGGGDDDSTAAGVTASFKVDENAPDAIAGAAGPVLGLIKLSDPDMGDTHTVTVNDDRFQVIRHPAEGEEGSSLWLTLKSGETLDFEDDAGSTIMLTLTVTDSNGGSATTDVTIEVMNVNEAPAATGELPTVTGTAGEALAGDQTRIDLGMFFSDPDADDTLTYAATGGPSWLDFEVDAETGHGVLSGTPPRSGPDADAVHTVTITATDGGGLTASRSFTLVVDDGNDPITGMEFTNVVGDKQITTDTVKVNLRTSVEENEKGAAGGTLLGTFIARDADSPEHPNGMITWSLPPGRWSSSFEIDPESGELRLKEGVELDFEATPFTAPIREIRLEVKATDGGDPKMSRTETLYIEVTDANDAPEANDTGINRGWWVTRDEDLESGDDQSREDYAEQGGWLTFGLETERGDDQRPAFTDPDGARTYTYTSISTDRGGDFLRIDPQTGVIQNRAGMVADEGLYTVTVQATDTGGETTDITFRLAVAESEFTDGAAPEPELTSGSPDDNDDPSIRSNAEDVDENAPAGTVVATFTVEDEELPLGPFHPWGRLDVDVSSSWDTGDRASPDGPPRYDDGVAQVGEAAAPGDYFSVHRTDDGTSDTASYEVRLTAAGSRRSDAETDGRDEVTFTIRASDGTFNATGVTRGDGDGLGDPASDVDAAGDGRDLETETVSFGEVNEAPYLDRPINEDEDGNAQVRNSPPAANDAATSRLPLTFAVQQEEENERFIFLNLTDMIVDPEDDDVEYSAAIAPGASSWLSIAPVRNYDLGGTRTGPQKWEEIEVRGAGNEGQVRIGSSNIEWLTDVNTDDPADDDIVLILRVDRDPDDDGGSNAQDANAVLTVTATDDNRDPKSSTTSIVFAIGDENLPASDTEEDPVVTLSGAPREVNDLTATFDKLLDPDFTGTEALDENPILVRYQWVTFDREYVADSGLPMSTAGVPDYEDDPNLRQETTENHVEATGRATYTVQQSDVGGRIEGRVIYYELFDGEIVVSDTDGADGIQGYASARTSEIQNVPNEESMSFEVRTESMVDAGETTHYLRITPTLDRGPRDRPRDENGDVIGTPSSAADADDTGYGYDFNYEWQYSPNGRTDWQAIRDLDTDATDDDRNRLNPDDEGRRLELPEGVEGGYVRLVVIYRDEGDLQDNQVVNRVNRVESEAVKVGDIMHVNEATGTITAATTDLHIDASGGIPLVAANSPIPAGWTLQIDGLTDVRGGRSTVEWEVGGTGGSPARWTKVGEGREYTVTLEDRGQLRAIVTRYDADDGLVSKTTVGLPTGVMLTQNVAPAFARPGADFVDLGKAPDADGKYAMLTGEIKLQSLFTDPEGKELATFNVYAPVGGFGAAPTDQIDFRGNTLDLWHDLGTNQGGHPSPELGTGVANSRIAAEGDQLLLINEKTGEVEYHSTQAQDHGREASDENDGLGNWITVRVIGRDSGGLYSLGVRDDAMGGAAAKEVNLRIDAAPTGFQVSGNDATKTATAGPADNTANRGTVETGTTEEMNPQSKYFGLYQPMDGGEVIIYTLREHNSDDEEAVGSGPTGQTDPRVVARIDVQDDNMPTHAYGQYTFTVNDDRFEVASVRGGNASQGDLRLKTGQSLDFEALTKGQPYDAGQRLPIELEVTATPADHPGGGDGHDPIRLSITVHVINVDEKTDPHEDDVPGLEDDEQGPGTSATAGNDAGPNPPVPAESTDSGDEVKGDDTDTTDDTDADDDTGDGGDADGDHDGGWWSASDDGLF